MGRHNDTARLVSRPPNDQHGSTRRRRALALAVVASAGLWLSACGGDDEEGSAATEAPATAEASGDDALAIGDSAADTAAAVDDGGAEPDPGGIDLGAIGRDVIIEMQVSMSSDDIRRSVASISARASALGGGIASSTVEYGDPNEPGSASGFAVLVVKVPPATVDELIGGLGESGTVRSINQSAQDVTDQLVDLDVRIANARQSVTNVREFMGRTENLTELVTLEAELTRRQTELEQLEAQQRNLSDRVALSTITVEIVPTAAVPASEADDGVRGALSDGWSAFVAVLYGLVVVLAVLAPFLVTGAAIASIAWWMMRRRGNAGSPADPATVDTVTERDDVPTPMG